MLANLGFSSPKNRGSRALAASVSSATAVAFSCASLRHSALFPNRVALGDTGSLSEAGWCEPNGDGSAGTALKAYAQSPAFV